MIDLTRTFVTLFAGGTVIVVAVLMYRYHIEKLRQPPPKPSIDVKGAITQLQDSFDAGGRAHVRRCDELEDSFEAQRRAHDKRFYEIEQQVMRITNERETDKVQFESRMTEVAAERNKLSAMLSTRVPHSRMG